MISLILEAIGLSSQLCPEDSRVNTTDGIQQEIELTDEEAEYYLGEDIKLYEMFVSAGLRNKGANNPLFCDKNRKYLNSLVELMPRQPDILASYLASHVAEDLIMADSETRASDLLNCFEEKQLYSTRVLEFLQLCMVDSQENA